LDPEVEEGINRSSLDILSDGMMKVADNYVVGREKGRHREISVHGNYTTEVFVSVNTASYNGMGLDE